MASLTVLRVRGIPVRIHPTLVIVLPLFAFLMARAHFAPEGAPDALAWAWGGLLAVGLFASVLMHELAHSLVALREGVRVRHITLLPIGGVSMFERAPDDPWREFRITIVGPLSNLVVGAPLVALVALGWVPATPWQAPAFVETLGEVNLLLGGFNLLLPAFPMDGGRILRALLQLRLGRLRATRAAAVIGQGLALVMGAIGFLTLPVGGWLLLLIAVFVFLGARSEEAGAQIAAALEHHHVHEIMTTPVATVREDARASEALARMLDTRHVVLPVVDAENHPVGTVHLTDLRDTRTAERSTCAQAMRAHPATTEADRDASDLTATLSTGAPMLVVDEGGHLMGIVTATDVLRFAEIAQARQSPV